MAKKLDILTYLDGGITTTKAILEKLEITQIHTAVGKSQRHFFVILLPAADETWGRKEEDSRQT